MVFRGGAVPPEGETRPETVVDGDSAAGPSPMDHVLLGLAGCMAADVRMILEKSRVSLEALEVEVEGERAPEPPRRYVRIHMVYRVKGPREEDQPKLERAVQLSRDTYCSVVHSLQPDIALTIDILRV